MPINDSLTSSATQLTGAEGSILGVGTVIHAENEANVILHPPIGEIVCSKSTVEGEVTNAGGTGTTVSGNIFAKGLTFGECNATVHVLKEGSLEIHAIGGNNGTLTSSNAEVTVELSGFHCVFKTTNTDLGTVTGSATTGGAATLDIDADIPRTGGRSGIFCGSEAEWTGSYKVTTPTPLFVT